MYLILLPIVGLSSKTCLKRPLKDMNTQVNKVVKTNEHLMQVQSIAEFCNTLDLHYGIIGLDKTINFLSFVEWPLKTGFTVYN